MDYGNYTNSNITDQIDDDDNSDDTNDSDIIMLPPPIFTSNPTHECPYCHLPFAPIDLLLHLRENHPLTLSLWIANSITVGSLADTIAMLLNGSAYGTLGEDIDEPEIESYEYWMQLEELMGNHETGVENIESAAPYTLEYGEFTCPICLELIEGTVSVRKISACGHLYCATCIERWLSIKRVCPVCRAECISL